MRKNMPNKIYVFNLYKMLETNNKETNSPILKKKQTIYIKHHLTGEDTEMTNKHMKDVQHLITLRNCKLKQ